MEIINFKFGEGSDKFFAEFSINISAWGITFHKFKLILGKNNALFMAGPSYFTEGADGKKQWHKFIEFTKDKKESFDNKVMALLKPFIDQRLKLSPPDDPALPF